MVINQYSFVKFLQGELSGRKVEKARMDVYSVGFFGHREVSNFFYVEKQLEKIIRELLMKREYVEFLVGRNGEFDQIVSSTVRRMKRKCGEHNSALVLVLPYPTAEYMNNEKSFQEYYDEIEICDAAASAHFKAAMQIRNREMIDRADLVISYIEHPHGGAYKTIQYAQKQNKTVINLAEKDLNYP